MKRGLAFVLISLSLLAQNPQTSPDVLKQMQEALGRPQEVGTFVPTCETVSTNAMRVLPDLVEKADYARVRLILSEWDRHCGFKRSEPQVRSRLLFNFAEKGEIDFRSEDIEVFMEYQNRYSTGVAPNAGKDATRLVLFDSYTFSLASRALSDRSRSRHPLLHYYGHEFEEFHKQILTDTTSELGQAFQKYRDRIVTMPVFNLGFYSGAWHAVGPASILGTHPILGFYLGPATYRVEASIHLQFRFLNSSAARDTVYEGQLISTKYYSGAYFGFEMTYNLSMGRNYDLGITVAPGFDQLYLVEGREKIKTDYFTDNFEKTKGQRTSGIWVVSFGPTLRYYPHLIRSSYIYLTARVTPLYYNNSGGSDLSGVGLTFYFGFGMMYSRERENRLRNIGGL